MSYDASSDNDDDIRAQLYYGDLALERQLKELWRQDIMSQCRGQSLVVDLLLQICEQLKEERDEAEENLKKLENDNWEQTVQIEALQSKISALQLKHNERENEVLRLQAKEPMWSDMQLYVIIFIIGMLVSLLCSL